MRRASTVASVFLSVLAAKTFELADIPLRIS